MMIFNPFLPRVEARVLQRVQTFGSVDEILKFEPFKRFWNFKNLAFSQTKRELKRHSYPAKFKMCCLKARICKTKPREVHGTKHSIDANIVLSASPFRARGASQSLLRENLSSCFVVN